MSYRDSSLIKAVGYIVFALERVYGSCMEYRDTIWLIGTWYSTIHTVFKVRSGRSVNIVAEETTVKALHLRISATETSLLTLDFPGHYMKEK